MKLLIYHKNDYLFHDLCDILDRKHVTYSVIPYTLEDKYDDQAFWGLAMGNISFSKYDALISVNYYPILAKLCNKAGLKYIAWWYP